MRLCVYGTCSGPGEFEDDAQWYCVVLSASFRRGMTPDYFKGVSDECGFVASSRGAIGRFLML